MATKVFSLALGFVLLVGSAPALAEVYTWVDEQGKVHFSDTPRGGAKRVAPEPSASTSSSTDGNAQARTGAIPYRGNVPSLRLALTDVRLDLPARGQTRLRVGRRFHGYHCNSRADDLLVDLGKKLQGSTTLPRDFHRRLAELAYQPPEFSSNGRQRVTTAELQAVPTVTGISIRACSSRRRPDGQRLPDKNLVEVTIRWSVTDRLSQEQLFEGTTQGRFDRWNKEYGPAEKDKGIYTATRHALFAAAEQLLHDPEFVALLSPDGSLPAKAASTPGDGLSASSFLASLPAVRSATPMIRTLRRNGHGVLISADGHVLTNFRVVSNGREVTTEVMVVFESELIPGRVVRLDQTRRVALIQLERTPKARPLPIARTIGISEPVYVVGGPLEATLAHAVTQGVITANRTMGSKNTPYYLTNAAIDRDNPTGPALNGRGEVVALATGLGLTRTPGVHYLIPIHDALKTLGITP